VTTERRLIGSPVRRHEDRRFITGYGQFVDDISPSRLLHGFTVRSSWASGKDLRIDATSARAAPGVRLVLTGEDLGEAGLAYVPVDLPPPGMSFETWSATPQPTLARDEIRYVGDAIAFIVADNLAAAHAGAEVLDISITETPATLDLANAKADFSYAEGNPDAVSNAMREAAGTITATLAVHRVDALPLEPRGCIGSYEDGQFTLQVSTQRVQIIQRALADRVFYVPRDRIRVVAPDTGGGFGQKNGLYPEYVLCLEAARRLRRPVKWVAERSEGLSAGCHARDNLFSVTAALDGHGRITALDGKRRMNMGAYTSSRSMVPVQNGLTHLTGVYAIPQAHVEVQGVLTNTAPTCSYRGAGRPENVYACERFIDIIARRTGQDPIALRRAQLVKPKQMPWTTPLGTCFDQQDFEALLDRALLSLDHAGLAARRAAAIARKQLRGFGVALFAEDLHGSHEPIPARLELNDGMLELIVGTGSAGHSHETTFRQIVAERLFIPIDRLGFRQSDTARMSEGVGTAASWSTTLCGSSVSLAADAAVQKGREIAGALFETSVDDVAFAQGQFQVVGTDRSVSWEAVFAAVPDFKVHGCFAGSGQNVPAACHACEVEIDSDTGACTIVSYAIVQSSGTVINPMIFTGQLHGGMAQGIGQNWMEEIVYDRDTGQLLSGALTDYALPRASDLPVPRTTIIEIPAVDNPLGVKGVGEAAATGSPAAFANAVLDALWPLGVVHLDPPFTAEKLWRAIRAGDGHS
jgi:carbon-monoxide dehydrogenase large subunit